MLEIVTRNLKDKGKRVEEEKEPDKIVEIWNLTKAD